MIEYKENEKGIAPLKLFTHRYPKQMGRTDSPMCQNEDPNAWKNRYLGGLARLELGDTISKKEEICQ